jgi:hypothetical protein
VVESLAVRAVQTDQKENILYDKENTLHDEQKENNLHQFRQVRREREKRPAAKPLQTPRHPWRLLKPPSFTIHQTSLSVQLYDFKDWAAHRSTRRYLRHLHGIFSSRVLMGLRWPLVCVFLEATLVTAYESLLKQGLLPLGFKSIQVKVRPGPAGPSMITCICAGK